MSIAIMSSFKTIVGALQPEQVGAQDGLCLREVVDATDYFETFSFFEEALDKPALHLLVRDPFAQMGLLTDRAHRAVLFKRSRSIRNPTLDMYQQKKK